MKKIVKQSDLFQTAFYRQEQTIKLTNWETNKSIDWLIDWIIIGY